jgi:hypothetical protein
MMNQESSKSLLHCCGSALTSSPNETLTTLGRVMQRANEIIHVAEPTKAYQVCVFDDQPRC